MSIKPIAAFLLFAALAVYFAFLNPGEIRVRVTQSYALDLPLVAFMLGSVLTGVLVVAVSSWVLEIRRFFWNLRTGSRSRREEKLRKRAEECYAKGEAAWLDGDIGKSKSFFEKVLRDGPLHGGALYHLGLIEKQDGKIGRALELHSKAAQIDPGNTKVLYGLSEDLLEAGRDDEALEVFQKIRDLNRGSPVPLYKLRDFYLRKEDWGKAYSAQKTIMSLIHHDSGDLEAEQNRFNEIIYCKGMSLYKSGQVELAIVEFKRATRENRRCLPPYVTLGEIYFQSGEIKQALKAWKAGYENTRSPVCLQKMQKAYDRLEKPREILKMYQEAIRFAKNAEKNALVLIFGAYLLDREKPDEALEALKAFQDSPSMLHRILLTKAYDKTGKNPGAAEKTFQIVFDIARQSVLEYACNVCKTSVREWSGYCPYCKTWNSLSNSLISLPSTSGK